MKTPSWFRILTTPSPSSFSAQLSRSPSKISAPGREKGMGRDMLDRRGTSPTRLELAMIKSILGNTIRHAAAWSCRTPGVASSNPGNDPGRSVKARGDLRRGEILGRSDSFQGVGKTDEKTRDPDTDSNAQVQDGYLFIAKPVQDDQTRQKRESGRTRSELQISFSHLLFISPSDS